jgi:predicted nucleotidyltransferase/predicted transcriptional regulator
MGILFEPLDALLSSRSKVRLLRVLIPAVQPVSGREAARLARVARVPAARSLEELVDLGILQRQATASQYLYRVNPRHQLTEPLAALFATEEQRWVHLRDELRQALEAAGLLPSVAALVLFGSNVRRDARPGSDLDLLAVVKNEPAVDPVRDALLNVGEVIRNQLGLCVSPLVLVAERAVERFREGDPLMREILEEGRTMLGRPFHELVGAG